MDYKKLVKVADAKAEKRYRITQTHYPMSGEPRKYTMEGTLEELIEAYSYTLEVGHSWESERGNKKINMHPTTIKALCVNLENAKNNAARNGYSGDSFEYEEIGSGVADSAEITKSVEFCIDEDNVYDLIHEGETGVAIPSGADTKAFVAAVEDILKEVASDCGVKGLKIETEIAGNRVNVIKK